VGFDTLIKERGVTLAGERLGLKPAGGQPSAEPAGYMLNDELLVHMPDGVRPTARAAEIAPRGKRSVRNACC